MHTLTHIQKRKKKEKVTATLIFKWACINTPRYWYSVEYQYSDVLIQAHLNIRHVGEKLN